VAALKKVDTSSEFRPRTPTGPDIHGPAVASIRLDGALDRSLLSPHLHQTLLGMARIRNAVSSLQLEGEPVELGQARQVVTSRKPGNSAERGVVNLASAYEDLANGKLPIFSLSGIRESHRRLFQGVLESNIVGELKKTQNAITDVTGTRTFFLPTPPERTGAEMDSLFRWLTGNTHSAFPPVVAALFFAEFQAIHPFADGNGRLGRYLNVALLYKLGLKNIPLVPLDTRFFRTSESYYECLASTNSGRDYHVWTRYYLRQLQRAYQIAVRRGDLATEVNRFSKNSTQGLLRWILLGSGEWFGRGDYPNRAGYSGPALWGALKELVAANVLEQRGAGKGRQYRLSSKFMASVYGRLVD
jgi:Fic family protein